MSLDLNQILGDWPHEPGQIKVRKVAGLDGREKLQLRIDLGVIQMEMTGRPDGTRPKGCESLLAFHQQKAKQQGSEGSKYELSADDCGELQQEGIQYYHRYLALYQLKEYDAVIRDTQRNLDLFAFVTEHVERDEMSMAFQQFRPYVLMMNTRAKAAQELDNDNYGAAIRFIEKGREMILEFYKTSGNPEAATESAELSFLDDLLEEVRSKRPLTKVEKLKQELDTAVASEAYERAAQLRDAIRELGRNTAG